MEFLVEIPIYYAPIAIYAIIVYYCLLDGQSNMDVPKLCINIYIRVD